MIRLQRRCASVLFGSIAPSPSLLAFSVTAPNPIQPNFSIRDIRTWPAELSAEIKSKITFANRVACQKPTYFPDALSAWRAATGRIPSVIIVPARRSNGCQIHFPALAFDNLIESNSCFCTIQVNLIAIHEQCVENRCFFAIHAEFYGMTLTEIRFSA